MNFTEPDLLAANASRPSAALPDAHALVSQLGSEVATALSSALERVVDLAATGRIDRGALRLLREEIDLARRAGIMGQQLVRLVGGQMQLTAERLNLTDLLHEALAQRGREIEARGVEVRQMLTPCEVRSDGTLLFSLLQAVLDWSFEHAVARIDLGLSVKEWPGHARLVCTFAHRPADEAEAGDDDRQGEEALSLNSMAWHLLARTAAALRVGVERRDSPGRTALSLTFPDTLRPKLPGFELSGPGALKAQEARNEMPLAGRHVLVLAARREVRHIVREALRPMGMMVDFVTSVEQAAELAREAMPHALVYEGTLAGGDFDRLRAELLAEAPRLALIRIGEQGRAFEILNVGGQQVASVGRDAIIDSLPAALRFELTRSA